MKAKIVENVTWHCCMCCDPAKGRRVEFADGWLIKSSFIIKDEMKACQLTRTKSKIQKIYLYKNLENNMKKIYLKCMKILKFTGNLSKYHKNVEISSKITFKNHCLFMFEDVCGPHQRG
jgi:hypothetical protein